VNDDAVLDQVREVTLRVLREAPFRGQTELLAQVPLLQIDGGPITFLGLVVDRSAAPRSDFGDGPAPGFAGVFGEDAAPMGTLLLWIKDGYLSALEYAWLTDEPPVELPKAEQIRFGRS
jgi:hypothetical protein